MPMQRHSAFTVEGRAAENSWEVEPVSKSEIRCIFNAERATEEMFGSIA
jgi:hypothetical protein